MSSELQTSGHHDDIHLPAPSAAPIIVGLGITALVVGLLLLSTPVVGLPVFLVGLVVFLFGVWKISRFEPIALPTSMGVSSRMLGMWVFLASEIMFFTGLIATFLGYRARAGDVDRLLNVPLMTIGTFALLASSLAAVSALSAIQKGRMTAFCNWLILTVVLGASFLLIELTEWGELIGHGITTQTLFGSAFFSTTGFHGMHVIIGLVWMGFLLFRYFRGEMSSENAEGLEIFGLYWHFVDIVWIILFTFIYLL